MKRVVILGHGGGVLPGIYGAGSYEQHFNAHLEGKSGITELENAVTLTHNRTITHGGQVLVVPDTPYPRPVTRHAKKGITMGLLAGYHALNSTGLPLKQFAVDALALGLDPYRFPSWAGTGYGDAEANNEFHTSYLANKWGTQIGARAVQGTMPNGPSTTFAIVVGAKGKADTSSTACASSTDAFGNMFWLIKAGKADLGFVMGVDTLAHPAYYFVLFGLAGALSYKGSSIPFGKDRDGFVLAEGAVCAFLADLEFVKRNKLEAHILAEVAGYGATCDAKDMTAPDTDVGTRAVELAMEEARDDYGVTASTIDFWSAHGTSTPTGDQNEAEIIARVIDGTVYVSSTKAHIGHMAGPAGLAGVLTAAHACKRDKIPSMGSYEIDPSCQKGGITYVTGSAVQTKVRTAISVAFGFGGQNAAVVLRKYER